MNSEKQVSYEMMRGDESDEHHEEAQDHESAGGGSKRSYDCTFCRRGFTNAQALGGHMNIHRKDRAKAKQVIKPDSSSSLQNTNNNDEEFMSLHFSNQLPTRNYSILESQRNCDMYFHPPPNRYHGSYQPAALPYGHGFQHEFHNLRSQPVNFNHELRDANLSLQIGPSQVANANKGRGGPQKDSEVDLELRLGHDPC